MRKLTECKAEHKVDADVEVGRCHEGYPLLSSRMSVDRDEHGELVYIYTPFPEVTPR